MHPAAAPYCAKHPLWAPPDVCLRALQALARCSSAAERMRPPTPVAGQRSPVAAGVAGPLSAARPPRPRESGACQASAGDGDDGGWGGGGSGGDDNPSGGGDSEGPDGEGDDSVMSLLQVRRGSASLWASARARQACCAGQLCCGDGRWSTPLCAAATGLAD